MRLFLLALALIYVVGVSYARTILLGGEACAVNGDAARYVIGAAPERVDHDQWNKIANQAKPVNGLDGANAQQSPTILARNAVNKEAAAERPCR